MGLKGQVKGYADEVYQRMLSGLPTLPASHCMSGAIWVASADKNTIHFKFATNYQGSPELQQDYHVEKGLLSALFDWTRGNGRPYVLPANSIVYIYVYDSPCKLCTENLAPLRNIKSAWMAKNPKVIWKLAWSQYFVGRTNGYGDSREADAAYGHYLSHFASKGQI